MSDLLLCLSLPEGLLGWAGLRVKSGLVYRRTWSLPSHLEVSLEATVALCLLSICCSPWHVCSAWKVKKKKKKLFFFLFCFLHFAWLDEMLDWFLLNAEWGQCLSCADMGVMCSLSALTLSPQTMFAHWNLRYQLSASGSVSPSSPSVICCATIPKPLHLPGVIGQTEGRNVSFCFPCHHVLLQRSYFLCSRCAEGVWVLRDADSPVGFVQTHLSSSRLLLGLSNSYQNQ